MSIDPPVMWQDLKLRFSQHRDRFPEGFSFDRNGVRLGIAALQDELNELYTEWVKHHHNVQIGRERMRDELLDIAAVAMYMIFDLDDNRSRIYGEEKKCHATR